MEGNILISRFFLYMYINQDQVALWQDKYKSMEWNGGFRNRPIQIYKLIFDTGAKGIQ